MELKLMEALVAVVRSGSFSAAAKALHTTQPSISKAIQQLEHECRFPLLNRFPKGITLTNAGEIVYHKALALLAGRDQLLTELEELRGLQRGTLKLGLPPLGSNALFAPLFAKFRQLHPGIEIALYEAGSHHLEKAVRSGELELGVSLQPIPRDFAWLPVCDEPIVALLPPDHRLAANRSLRLKDLAGEPLILFEEGFALNSILRHAYQKRHMELQASAYSGHVDFILALVSAGLGIAMLPRLVIQSRGELPVIAMALAEPDIRWQPGIIWKHGRPLSSAAQQWLELLKQPG